MEFLKVTFPGVSRLVLVNGAPRGHTNTVMSFQLPGTYIVSLGHPQDFFPSSVTVDLFLTSPFDPPQVSFSRLPASVHVS